MQVLFQTDRLAHRELRISDAEQLYALNLDPEVVKYTGDPPFRSVEDARLFLKNYRHYCRYEYGRWAVLLKEQEYKFMGWCGLKYTPELKEVDLGFRLFKKYWGMGFATESAKAALQHGFQHFDIPRIVGRAMKANQASIRVMEKVGMTYWKDFVFDGNPGVYYKIERIDLLKT
ncbi:MAG: GNAT family N-acetyltransferase [Bacteroidetes bacterium]|nr:GNAT family N-acetyltransferase [Bacteroidota bacterium]